MVVADSPCGSRSNRGVVPLPFDALLKDLTESCDKDAAFPNVINMWASLCGPNCHDHDKKKS